MKHSVDLSKYQIRTDLAIESIKDIKNISKEKIEENIKITNVVVDDKVSSLINKKKGNYITIEFDDVTDSSNYEKVKKVFVKELRCLLNKLKIDEKASCLIIGLGNSKSTPDSLGPLTINNIIVTNHLYELDELSNEYRRVSVLVPGVMGQTGLETSDVISSTADWSRLGYNLDDSKVLSDLTTLYQRVGDNMTQESASEALISTLQGYQMTADQAEHIVDAFNEVGNKFAIGSDGIGEALQRSASSMYAANNTMEETIGLVTAANTVVQDPESVGTAFKTLSMRIRGATTELEAAGLDTEGMAESTAKLREEILALSGVDIMADKNTFKSTYDILDELASKWQDLTDIQQAATTELIAGSNVCQYV